jgi:hypothetical protein
VSHLCVWLSSVSVLFKRSFGLHFCYWCMVVLWPGRIPSGFLHHTCEDVSMVPSPCLSFLFFEKKNSFGLGKGVSTLGAKEGRKGTIFFFNFFHCTWSSGVNSLHNYTWRDGPLDTVCVISRCQPTLLIHQVMWQREYNMCTYTNVCKPLNPKVICWQAKPKSDS